jgi:acetyl esterase/lipase
MAEDTPATFAFKQLGDLTLYIDVYPPTKTKADLSGPGPAVVYFHGGGMAAGHRASILQKWLIGPSSCSLFLPSLLTAVPFPGRTTAAGLAFISADYRLLPPSTGHDVVQDIVDLFAFLARTPKLGTTLIDPTRLAVAGMSAGGICTYLAAIHANPRPRAVLSYYGLGGNFFVSALPLQGRSVRLSNARLLA